MRKKSFFIFKISYALLHAIPCLYHYLTSFGSSLIQQMIQQIIVCWFMFGVLGKMQKIFHGRHFFEIPINLLNLQILFTVLFMPTASVYPPYGSSTSFNCFVAFLKVFEENGISLANNIVIYFMLWCAATYF